jgi:hypothetical protein
MGDAAKEKLCVPLFTYFHVEVSLVLVDAREKKEI